MGILRDPPEDAYLITNRPIQSYALFDFLANDYILVADMGDRFRSLHGVPGLHGGRDWPRYLYAFIRNHSEPKLP